MSRPVIFCADLHGSIPSYERILRRAGEIDAQAVLLGGDLGPNLQGDNVRVNDELELQMGFAGTFAALMEVARTKWAPKTRIIGIMGNDDYAAASKFYDNAQGFERIDNGRASLEDGLQLAGYPCVPLTCFTLKDYERFDMATDERSLLAKMLLRRNNHVPPGSSLTGVISQPFLSQYTFDPNSRGMSIQEDLQSAVFTQDPAKTIYLFHTPAFNTRFDYVSGVGSTGSVAIRKFMEQYQPLATLHGHIHEGAIMAKAVRQDLGKTIMLHSGNGKPYIHGVEYSPRVCWLEFDPQNIRGSLQALQTKF